MFCLHRTHIHDDDDDDDDDDDGDDEPSVTFALLCITLHYLQRICFSGLSFELVLNDTWFK